MRVHRGCGSLYGSRSVFCAVAFGRVINQASVTNRLERMHRLLVLLLLLLLVALNEANWNSSLFKAYRCFVDNVHALALRCSRRHSLSLSFSL